MTLNVVCINAENYLGRGADYVNILCDMVLRNLSDKTDLKFICFTDNPQGIDTHIDTRPLPVQVLSGSWNKLGLFKNGVFPDGDRILYLDLNVVITSSLDEIVDYKGDFAILRDFANPALLDSSVMAWEAGKWNKLWNDYGGYQGDVDNIDQWLTIKLNDIADSWQELFPNAFADYNIHALTGIPKDSRIINFCGKARPHEIAGWMSYVWKVGGGSVLELTHQCNTDEAELNSNVKHALSLPFDWLKDQMPHDGHAVIVGGGPSLKNFLEDIRERQRHGQMIFATNNAYGYLVSNGIMPNAQVLLDAREENKEFVNANYPCAYYIASQCHPAVFEKLKGNKVTVWHAFTRAVFDVIGNDTGDMIVDGGPTVGMKSISLAYILGYRKFHLYGFDSSYSEGKNHAYPQALNDKERVIDVVMNGQKYKAAAWMCDQVEKFKEIAKELVNNGCILTVHGTGLLPDVAKLMARPNRVMNAVYDLAVSPPSYEIVSFLCAAEKHRIAGGYDGINIIFQPGLKGGFRDDDLPPNVETRKAMLSRVCIPACKLLPSVKDITVLANRKSIVADFPVGWSVENPVACYGLKYMRKGHIPNALTASDSAKEIVKNYIGDDYITITLRESSYWPDRNSNKEEWEKARLILEDAGYNVVVVPDTEADLSLFSWDIDLRAALYQGASLNLGVANGPMGLCILCDAPYIMFRPVTENNACVTLEFYERNGMKKGDQMNANGRLIWEDDTCDVIMREVNSFFNHSQKLRGNLWN